MDDNDFTVEATDEEIRHQRCLFIDTLDRVVTIENHTYKLIQDDGTPDYHKLAKILNKICYEKNIEIEVFASEDGLIIESKSWKTEVFKLKFLMKWFRFFYRHQARYKEYFGI